jgi:hypothetical protein
MLMHAASFMHPAWLHTRLASISIVADRRFLYQLRLYTSNRQPIITCSAREPNSRIPAREILYQWFNFGNAGFSPNLSPFHTLIRVPRTKCHSKLRKKKGHTVAKRSQLA